MSPARNAQFNVRDAHPHGLCVLELIVVVPIVMMFLLGIVTFGLLLSESSQVLQAANVGAQSASLQSRSTATALLPVVTAAVDAHLTSANIAVGDANRQVIVESLTVDSSSAAIGPTLYTPSDSLVIPADSVRVTVAVRLNALSEDFVSTYGFSIADGYAYYRVVKKYNGPTP